jgi:thioredoxin reductase (NADPH)
MLTTEDVAAVPLFSALPAVELDRLARNAADLHLSSGEFAVPEGGEAALFAVIEGAIEVVKSFDGIDRVIGRRLPGTIFGEVPITLGSRFPGGYRATEPSRVMRIEVQHYYAEILVTRSVAGLDAARYGVHLDDDELVRARSLIVATGVPWRRLGIEGFDRLIGKGVYYGAARSEASSTHGQDVFLVGAGDSAGQAALFFANHARTVTLVVRGDSLERSMSHYLIEQLQTKSNIAVMRHSEVRALHGETNLTAVDIHDKAADVVRRHDCGGLFVFIGADAETGWLPAGIERDRRGYILTGDDVAKAGAWSQARDPYLLETSAPGVFACGDVRLSPVKRVASAVGEGSMAIAFVHQFLAHA